MSPDQYNAAAATFEEDLHNLADFTFTNGPVQRRHMRLVSTILRRWFCDNDLATKIGHPLGVSSIEVPVLQDDAIFDRLPTTPEVVYYISAGVKFDGRPFRSLYHSLSDDPPSWQDDVGAVGQDLMKIGKAKRKRVLYFQNTSFRLEEVVRFCANKLGGTHLDHTRDEVQTRLEAAVNYATFGGPLEQLETEPVGQLHFAVEPNSNEWMSAAYVVLVASAAMLLHAHFDGQPIVQFDIGDDGLSIALPQLPRMKPDGVFDAAIGVP